MRERETDGQTKKETLTGWKGARGQTELYKE